MTHYHKIETIYNRDTTGTKKLILGSWCNLKDTDTNDVYVIGGAQIYKLMLPHIQGIYVSEVAGEWEADTWFPEFKESFPIRKELETFDGFVSTLYTRQ